jgi:hypothetical protein
MPRPLSIVLTLSGFWSLILKKYPERVFRKGSVSTSSNFYFYRNFYPPPFRPSANHSASKPEVRMAIYIPASRVSYTLLV